MDSIDSDQTENRMWNEKHKYNTYLKNYAKQYLLWANKALFNKKEEENLSKFSKDVHSDRYK